MMRKHRPKNKRRGSLFDSLQYSKVHIDFKPAEKEEETNKETGENMDDSETNSAEDTGTLDTTQLTGDQGDDCEKPMLGGFRTDAAKPKVARRRSSHAMKKNTDVEKQAEKKHDQVSNYKGYVKLCLCGLSLIAFGYILYVVNPLLVAKEIALSLKEGSYLANVWKAPPIKLYIKAYLFNITNSERFLKGYDKKLKMVEVGPYVYSESLENTNVSWNPNGTMSFTPKRSVRFVPELSIGDPENDTVTVPNVPLLGIASMIHKSSMAMNLALSSVVNFYNAKTIMNMSVDEYLWGYDDPLIELASRVLPSWINFRSFGLLDRMLDEGDNRVTVTSKSTNSTVGFSIQFFNGLPYMKQWYPQDNTEDGKCSSLEGAIEGLILPRDLNPNLPVSVYRKAFCRTLPLRFINHTVNERGFPMYLYTLKEDAMDPTIPENECYCNPKQEPCLPRGMSDMSPCYYGIPLAMSKPHYLDTDEIIMKKSVEGMNPDVEKHSTTVGIQPDSGVPLFMKSRLQMSLTLKKVRYISRVKPFNDMYIPIIWIQVELEELPGYVIGLLNLLLISGPVIQSILTWGSIAGGLVLIFVASTRYVWRSRFLRQGPSATMISYSKKYAGSEGERSVWSAGQYTQLIPLPINPLSTARSR